MRLQHRQRRPLKSRVASMSERIHSGCQPEPHLQVSMLEVELGDIKNKANKQFLSPSHSCSLPSSDGGSRYVPNLSVEASQKLSTAWLGSKFNRICLYDSCDSATFLFFATRISTRTSPSLSAPFRASPILSEPLRNSHLLSNETKQH